MFTRLWNHPISHPWGQPGGITRLLGTPGAAVREPGDDDERREAELWLGAHHGSPSCLDPAECHGARDLAEWIALDPVRALGEHGAASPRLPFLLKVLAADRPLSLQVHPALDQAAEGYEREQREGIPLDAPERNYRDPFHKPELIVAESESMAALAGFREPGEVRAWAARTGQLAQRADEEAGEGAAGGSRRLSERLRPVLGRFQRLRGTDDLRELLEWLLRREERDAALALDELLRASEGTAEDERAALDRSTARLALDAFPGDPGVFVAMLLRRVNLPRGDGLFVRAGCIHAYLRGTGIEVMAASDNVLRCGLTPKHIDARELLRLVRLDFDEPPIVRPLELAPGISEYPVPVPDFRLVRVELDDDGSRHAVLPVSGPAILLALSGEFKLSGSKSTGSMRAGEVLYATPEEREMRFGGRGRCLVATTATAGAFRPVPGDA